MAQIFHRSTNTVSRASIIGLGIFVIALFFVMGAIQRSPYVTQARVAREQPVPFSHRHHVSQLGIDCRYCHTSVEESNFAGIPPISTCMGCHSQIHAQSPMLEPVRESFRSGKPLKWVRVNDLPDFVYFNHSIHVKKGIGCETCHGPVGEMTLTWRQNTLYMEWCLDCHRHPEKYVRPHEEVFTLNWQPPADGSLLAKKLVKEYKIKKQEDCSICHR
ncbi:MAG: cytochrome C [Calditrichaeota bacterium]|nr:MAG: cytochrome C [Calditrichota bacterium]